MTIREASCSCGQLRVTARGKPVRVSVCHCHACKQRTGSAFGYQARFPREAVTMAGESREYVRVADSGRKIFHYFCPECGNTVQYRLEVMPDVIAIPAGAFADSHFPAPQFSVWETRAHDWLTINSDVEHDP